MKYTITNSKTGKTMQLEANSPEEASLKALEDMGFVVEEVKVEEEIKIENQLDSKYNRYYMGKAKGYSFRDNACFLFSLSYLYSVKVGYNVSPIEVDKMFMDGGVYSGPYINLPKACKVLGLEYIGKETDVNKPPKNSPTIKEVDFSVKYGKQQHFVVRINDETGKYILDPWGGAKRPINYYEKKSSNDKNNPYKGWVGGKFSYRDIKVK